MSQAGMKLLYYAFKPEDIKPEYVNKASALFVSPHSVGIPPKLLNYLGMWNEHTRDECVDRFGDEVVRMKEKRSICRKQVYA